MSELRHRRDSIVKNHCPPLDLRNTAAELATELALSALGKQIL